MVITLAAQPAVTPDGNPVAVPIPVAPVVACVIFVINVPTQGVGDEEAAPAVFVGVTVTVLVAEAVQPYESVTVTVYVPAELTLILFVVPVLLHK